MRRVVVTGIGMCTPLGYGAKVCWQKLIKSESGIRKINGFEVNDLPTKIGGQIPLTGNTDYFPENVIEIKERRKKISTPFREVCDFLFYSYYQSSVGNSGCWFHGW